MSDAPLSRGSEWRRWDPHIHTPGTVLNNQYKDEDWDQYLTRIEEASPAIEALGVTDYCSLDRYEEVREYAAKGRLAGVGLIFPNVELRYPLMGKKSAINFHLLISPEDPEHVERARNFLRGLKFTYRSEEYSCDRSDLMRLGRKFNADLVDDGAALREGTNQFKVTPDALRDALAKSEWARTNILVAIAAGQGDGSSGLQAPDGALAATRTELEALSHAIFSGRPGDRDFWIGTGALDTKTLEAKYDGRKPCLHGSDAHELAKVGRPDGNRYTWIKGDPTFESLRQACIEPAGRSYVGEQPPSGPLDYRTIDSIDIDGAPWLASPHIDLNPGLTAIIGARGSGKTALADMITAAANAATPDRTSSQSFLKRASRHLSGASARLTWRDGATSGSDLPPAAESDARPLVQYLSQQFVDQLCSAEGMTDELLAEVERVVFDAHPLEDRLGAESFQDLLAIKAEPGRLKRQRAQDDIATVAELIDKERDARAALPALQEQRKKLNDDLQADLKARKGLIVAGGEARTRRLEAINTAFEAAQQRVDELKRRQASLARLEESTKNLREHTFVQLTEDLKAEHTEAGLSDDDWKLFAIQFAHDPRPRLSELQKTTMNKLEAAVGTKPSEPTEPVEKMAPYISDDADLTAEPLNNLRAERWRLGKLIGLDAAKTRQLEELNKKISTSQTTLGKLDEKIAFSGGAAARVATLRARSKASYARIFDGFDEEERELEALYSPLADELKGDDLTLGKLSFSVRRVADVDAWANRGEALLDLRRAGAFKGHDELLRATKEKLQHAWESGGSKEVATAMTAFRDAYDTEIVKQAPVSRATDVKAYRRWVTQVSVWLNSTDHTRIQYGIQYDGVDIEQLSPGTRGIVLLLLYLSLDQADDRPLLIDQPEENLDPKSIFDELVWRFGSTRARRQIIIVTHNANLVVNTDADQVIVANSGQHRPNKLPDITYVSSGLENPEIRNHVCEILEGGKDAFRERARRLRLRLR